MTEGINISGVAQAPTPPPAASLYGALAGTNTTSDLYTIDPATGVATSVGPIGFAVTALAFRPSNNVLFGATSPNSASNPTSLITIDPVTGAGTLVGAFTSGTIIGDFSFRSDDALYGYTPVFRTLRSIDPATGATTQVGVIGIPTSPPPTAGFGCAFDSTDNLYVFAKGTAGAFHLVDESTSTLTAQTALSGSTFAGGLINAASFDADDLCWVSVQTTTPDWQIATIDVATSTITAVGVTTSRMDALAWKLA